MALLRFLLSVTMQWLSASCMPGAEDAELLASGARISREDGHLVHSVQETVWCWEYQGKLPGQR